MFCQFLITLFLLVISNIIEGQEITGLVGRIVGGESTTIQAIPYQVSLVKNLEHFCGGARLSESWIITAAHCMGRKVGYKVRINSTLSNDGGEILDVIADYSHPLFNENVSYDYDVALVNVKKGKILNELRFARWPKCNAKSCDHLKDNYVEVSGWGVNNLKDNKTFELQKVRIPLISLSACQEIYKYDSPVTKHMFCAGYLKEGGKDACQGDSGGPATCLGDLVGVVSFGYECGSPNEPGIYTNLLDDGIQDWIEKTTGMRRNCPRKQSQLTSDVLPTSMEPTEVSPETLERE